MVVDPWLYTFPGWLAFREDKIKDWYEDDLPVHPAGAAGFMFTHKISGTRLVLEESHYFDPIGGWS